MDAGSLKGARSLGARSLGTRPRGARQGDIQPARNPATRRVAASAGGIRKGGRAGRTFRSPADSALRQRSRRSPEGSTAGRSARIAWR